jgi:hypothetical protein
VVGVQVKLVPVVQSWSRVRVVPSKSHHLVWYGVTPPVRWAVKVMGVFTTWGAGLSAVSPVTVGDGGAKVALLTQKSAFGASPLVGIRLIREMTRASYRLRSREGLRYRMRLRCSGNDALSPLCQRIEREPPGMETHRRFGRTNPCGGMDDPSPPIGRPISDDAFSGPFISFFVLIYAAGRIHVHTGRRVGSFSLVMMSFRWGSGIAIG